MTLIRLLWVFVLAMVMPAYAELLTDQPIQSLQLDQAGEKSIGLHSSYLENPGQPLTLQQAFASDRWTASHSANLNFGFSQSSYWIATRLSTSDHINTWFMRTSYALLDKIESYLCPIQAPIDTSNCSKTISGDQLPFSSRDIKHPELISRLSTLANEEYWLISHIQTQGSYQLPISLVDQNTLTDNLIISSVLMGGYISMLLIMGLYNLFLYLSTRDRSYLYYSLFVLSFLMFYMSYSGSAFQYLWPETPKINDFILPWMFSINLIAICLFIPRFLDLKAHGKHAHRLFRFYLYVAIAALALNVFVPYKLMVMIQNLMSITFTLSGLIVGLRFWLSGVSSARFFTIAWLFFIIGFSVSNARSLGLLPTNLFTLHGYQLGSFIEIVLLSLALGERITLLQKDRLENRKALLNSQAESIQHLRNYEDLYQNSNTGQFQLDEAGNFIKCNPAWRSMIGFSTPQQMQHANVYFQQLFNSEDCYYELFEQLQAHGKIQGFTTELKVPGKSQTMTVSLSLRQGLDGETASWIGSAQDITQQYAKEARLKQLQEEKTESLKQLLMGIAHEMNTPLGNIRTTQSFLTQHSQHNSVPLQQQELSEGLQQIEQNAVRLNELTNLMKHAAVRQQDYQKETINIRHWLQQWQQNATITCPHIQIDIKIHCFEIDLLTYPLALEQILNELLNNSQSHNQELAQQSKLTVQITLDDAYQSLKLRYSDNGQGVDETQRQNIFMPFFTTQRQQAINKGLGLYRTHNLITELLGGTVSWPEEKSGFCLNINLPAV